MVISLFNFSSCEKTKEVTKEFPKQEKLVMYKPSEMTLLMREMYDFQENSKIKIVKGELPLDFPEKFKKIHSTKLSNDFKHDKSFKGFTNLYYQDITTLSKSNKKNAKDNFNKTINTCVACHETTCTGPIPRIKKLLIKPVVHYKLD